MDEKTDSMIPPAGALPHTVPLYELKRIIIKAFSELLYSQICKINQAHS